MSVVLISGNLALGDTEQGLETFLAVKLGVGATSGASSR